MEGDQLALTEEIYRLQNQLVEQERRLARLEHQLQALDLTGPACPRCENRGLVPNNDRLYCPSCEYAHSL